MKAKTPPNIVQKLVGHKI